MFINYGDRNFWEYGCLVDAERAEPTSVKVICCRPFDNPDENGNVVYYFAECEVDTTDAWINKNDVCRYAGLDFIPGDDESLIRFAIACIEYYGAENFSSPYDGYRHDKEYIKEILKHRLIAYDNLEM